MCEHEKWAEDTHDITRTSWLDNTWECPDCPKAVAEREADFKAKQLKTAQSYWAEKHMPVLMVGLCFVLKQGNDEWKKIAQAAFNESPMPITDGT